MAVTKVGLRGQVTMANADSMRSFWDAKARENAMYFIHSVLDYEHPDEESFWSSGTAALDQTLAPFGRTIDSGDRVVEIGCGIGRITRPLAVRAAAVTGIDVSAEMIERARIALSDLDNVTLLVGNGRDLTGIPDAAADIVYSFIVFQHIPDPAITCGYIREIGRVLRPGGWTVFQVSERPEIHDVSAWPSERTARARVRRALGRQPRGVLDPNWLGSAVERTDLLSALADGGLILDATVGDGTQFCMVHAYRPSPDGPLPGVEGRGVPTDR
jgi:SAM-dependent methyltransferase